jgi:hypothetical protein
MKTFSLVRFSLSAFVALALLLTTGCVAFAQPAAEPKLATEPKKETKTADPKPAEAKPAEAKTADKKPDDEKKPDEEPAAPKTPVEAFKAANARWTAVDKRLAEIAASYGGADEAKRADLKAEYLKLVADSDKLLAELQSAAVAAFEAEPNKNADVTRTLMGLIAYDNRRDLYEDAKSPCCLPWPASPPIESTITTARRNTWPLPTRQAVSIPMAKNI